MLILVEDSEAVDVLHRDDGVLEPAFVPGFRGALLALHGIGIDIIARETVFGRDEIRRHALRHGSRSVLRWTGPSAMPHRMKEYRQRLIGFRTATDGHLVLAGHHLSCCEVHGIKARRAEAIDLNARHGGAVAGVDRSKACNIAAGLADRIDHAENNVIDAVHREVGYVLSALSGSGRQCQRRHLVQCAVGLSFAARRADVIVDKCLRHAALLRSFDVLRLV